MQMSNEKDIGDILGGFTSIITIGCNNLHLLKSGLALKFPYSFSVFGFQSFRNTLIAIIIMK